MRGRQLLSRHLEYFSILYSIPNYAEAARAIPMTYQGLRKSIDALEAEVGATLFEPGGNGQLVPTEYANMLFEMTRKWIHDTRDLERAFDRLRDDGVRTIGVGVATGVASILGSNLTSRFTGANPGLRLDVVEYADSILDQMLLEGDFDLAVTAAPYDENLVTIPLISFKNCIWIHKGSSLSQREMLLPADLEDQTIMIPDQHFKLQENLEETIRDAGVHPRSIKYCSDLFSSFLFALSGQGMGLGVSFIGNRLSEVESIVSIPFSDGLMHGYGVSYRNGYELSDTDHIVIEFLKRSLS